MTKGVQYIHFTGSHPREHQALSLATQHSLPFCTLECWLSPFRARLRARFPFFFYKKQYKKENDGRLSGRQGGKGALYLTQGPCRQLRLSISPERHYHLRGERHRQTYTTQYLCTQQTAPSAVFSDPVPASGDRPLSSALRPVAA